MFAKLLVIIVAGGATAVVLLANRQQRIDTAHEMAIVHQRLIEYRRALWALRTDVAGRCRPERIRTAMTELAETWDPIPAEPVAPPPAVQVATDPADGTDDLGG
ncbi:MAG: hypothetical protein ACYTG1_11965 [Planctomycetota bacterium]|jgi:hypothetical protein